MITSAERYERVQRIFVAACKLPPADRPAFLEQECGSDVELREEVESLLAAEGEASVWLPTDQGQTETLSFPAVPVVTGRALPAQIGKYRIHRVLGDGGMGVVYLAEQDHPRREVALKVIKPTKLSAELLRRFEHEASVLGRLRHPGIAQIYEAGVAVSDGGAGAEQPFFAMELVEGKPLTEYAAAHALDVRDRLALLIKVCDAVQHAHQKGVIHRDLKPANILVVDEDGANATFSREPAGERSASESATKRSPTGSRLNVQPKILDFGVARATDADVRATTLHTSVGQLVGTLPYMSPEQVSGNPDELDTRSDVYALGVIAYELLTGRLPYDLSRKLVPEAIRIIREAEPTPLSSLNRTLRGDVETIVGKALEKDKDRRYASANALAADVRRFLDDEAIQARPPSAGYQFGKFAKRNKGLVGGVAAALVMLILTGVGTGYGLVQARAERDVSRKAEERAVTSEEAARHEAATARRESQKQKAVNRFLQNMIGRANPEKAGKRRDITVREALDEAARQADSDGLVGEPEVEAAIRNTLAITYHSLGGYREAELHARRSSDLFERMGADVFLDGLRSKALLGTILQDQGRPMDAEPFLREALQIAGRDDADPGEYGTVLQNYATLLNDQGKPAESEGYFRQALAEYQRHFGGRDARIATTLNNLAGVLMAEGKLAEAGDMFREAIDNTRAERGEDHPHFGKMLGNYGQVLNELGRRDEAERYYTEALDRQRAILPPDHPDLAIAILNLAAIRSQMNRAAEAEPLLREAIGIFRRSLGDENMNLAVAVSSLGSVVAQLGRKDEAEILLRESLAMRQRLMGADHPAVATALNNIAFLLQDDSARHAEAEDLFRQGLAIRRAQLGEEHALSAQSYNNLAMLLNRRGQSVEAEQLAREALRLRRSLLGDDNPAVPETLTNLAIILVAAGRPAEAAPFQRESYEIRLRTLGAEHWQTLNTQSMLGEELLMAGQAEDAAPLLLAAAEGLKDHASAPRTRRIDALRRVVRLFEALDRPEAVADWNDKLAGIEDAPQPSAAAAAPK